MRLSCAVLLSLMLTGLAACGEGESGETQPTQIQPQHTKPKPAGQSLALQDFAGTRFTRAWNAKELRDLQGQSVQSMTLSLEPEGEGLRAMISARIRNQDEEIRLEGICPPGVASTCQAEIGNGEFQVDILNRAGQIHAQLAWVSDTVRFAWASSNEQGETTWTPDNTFTFYRLGANDRFELWREENPEPGTLASE